jgi:UDPglucose--hexose-1-phosphate uridylyltransferase
MSASDSALAASCFPGLGVHDVIVDTPRHVVSLTDMTVSEVTELLDVFRERLGQLSNEPYLEYALIFKNVGPTAGASLEHSHSQLLAIPIVPPSFISELEAARRWHEREGGCYYCQLLSQEQAQGERIVLRHSGFTAFCPFVSRFAYETWILPEAHEERFEATPQTLLSSLAETIQKVLSAIETRLGKPGYNVLLHTAPFRKQSPHFHWRLEILPSVSRAAGFEWGTGIHINPVFPEEAAQTLRAS